MNEKNCSNVAETRAIPQKRYTEFSSEDKHSSKYRKLMTEQKIKYFIAGVTSGNSFYGVEGNGCVCYPNVETKCPNNDDMTDSSVQLEHSHFHDVVNSFEVLTTEETNLLQNLQKSMKIVQKVAIITNAYPRNNQIVSLSKFPSNAHESVNSDNPYRQSTKRVVKTKYNEIDENCSSNGILNKSEDFRINITEPEKPIKIENVNAQDLSAIQIKEFYSIADLKYLENKDATTSVNIKSEKIVEIAPSKNVEIGYVETSSEKIYSLNENVISDNIYSECTKSVLKNVFGYEKTLPKYIDSSLKEHLETINTRFRDAIVHTNQPLTAANSCFENISALHKENINQDNSDFEYINTGGNILNNKQINRTEASAPIDFVVTEISNDPQQKADHQSSLLSKTKAITEVVSEVIISNDTKNSHVDPKNSFKTHTVEDCNQTPSTYKFIDINNDINQPSSDLNLAQLVLSLKNDVQELSKKVDKQGNILEAVVKANELNLTPLFTQTFQEKYNLQIPYTNIEDFNKFNQNLAKNTSFCNEFITSLCSHIDKNITLKRNILTMLRKYMSKELTVLYTASKVTNSKMVLKDTTFCKCLLQATRLTIRNGLLPLEHEKVFLKSLGVVISGAKSWLSHDDERKKRNKK